MKNLTQKKNYAYNFWLLIGVALNKSKLDCYRGKDCIERFCKDLKRHATEIIIYEKNEMIP